MQRIHDSLRPAWTAAALALGALGADAAQDLAIQAGRVITLSGEPIENGTILIQRGRITAVGAGVELPGGVVVLDHPELTAFPGFVDAYSARGMDRPNENLDVAPFLSVRDSIDPVNYFFENALRKGITTINVQQGPECVIGGQGLVVRPYGMTVDEMLVKTDAGIVLSVAAKRGKSTATQVQALRDAFQELRLHLEELVAAKQQGSDRGRREALFQGRDPKELEKPGRPLESPAWDLPGFELVPRAEVDEKLAPLLPLVEGKLPAFVHCERPGEVRHALEIAAENGFLARTTLVLEPACWKAAGEIAQAGVPVVLSEPLLHVERDPLTGEETETFVPGVFRDAGVRFALASPSEQGLWYQAALCVGLGLTREEALAAVTTTPAEMLGLGKRVGKLVPGADGNVLLLSGDPLSVTSFVEYVVLDGKLVYERSKDVRMKHLLEGVQPAGTSAAAGDGPEGDGDEHPAVEDEEEQPDAGEGPGEEDGDRGEERDEDEP
jgi:imidazolonepropionase-like amidohydrolase